MTNVPGHVLLVSASLQEQCTTDFLETVAELGSGIFLQPDPNGEGGFECANNGGFEYRTRTWFLPPESAGGPAVPAGASLVLRTSSLAGTGVVTNVAVRIEAVR